MIMLISPIDKQAARLAFEQLEIQRHAQIDQAALQAEQALTRCIRELEGSAADLKQISILGRTMLFLRGSQRPLWGFATLYLDWPWFARWTLTEKQETALIAINLLVLRFLFGERVVKNICPFIAEIFRARKG
ncbi:hypothetical protein [Microbulbifer spongiae]|uniref:Uncharacterized protein n=1 Tax=Microbulbifer spongiae TaxID=2944933 RepID=A0ABY9EB44_9GAMM|nr:hypothetical protein [Microbulbifer sp. MI-G]WKD48664.1 hypothetical protein M8T91_12150 [Microbulbifer sp. MI-G]